MSFRAILTGRLFVVGLACAVGASSALAAPIPGAECENKCSSVPIDDDGCPETAAVQQLCSSQGEDCYMKYCAMGLCYDPDGEDPATWLIWCTDEPE